jgi:hypothetical protein
MLYIADYIISNSLCTLTSVLVGNAPLIVSKHVRVLQFPINAVMC